MKQGKSTHKDATLSIRISSDVLNKLKTSALELNISVSDYITKLVEQKQDDSELDYRVKVLEDAVFRQKQVA